jgi:hypothetical protein
MSHVVKETAQPDSAATKSQFENRMGNPFLRVFFAFQSANRQLFGLSLLSYKTGDKLASRFVLGHLLIPLITQTIGNMMRDAFTDDDDDEIWTVEGYMYAMLLGPWSGALQFGPLLEEGFSRIFGVERRVAASPASLLVSAVEGIADDDINVQDVNRAMTEIGNWLGGRFGALGSLRNILKQIMGLAENAENDS